MTPTPSRTKTDRGYKYDHSRWICHDCLKSVCQCATCTDTTIVTVFDFDDVPTQVFRRAR